MTHGFRLGTIRVKKSNLEKRRAASTRRAGVRGVGGTQVEQSHRGLMRTCCLI